MARLAVFRGFLLDIKTPDLFPMDDTKFFGFIIAKHILEPLDDTADEFFNWLGDKLITEPIEKLQNATRKHTD